ncbi:MAG: hypothetical protein DPW12_09410 [Rhodocyclaceae bacterium]|nr:hypothetical protein [Rhodocyclaceae bacterium]
MIRRLAALGLLLFALNAQGQGSLYKWVDEKGVVHYSDTPPAGKAGEKFKARPQLAGTAAGLERAPLPGREAATGRTAKDPASRGEMPARTPCPRLAETRNAPLPGQQGRRAHVHGRRGASAAGSRLAEAGGCQLQVTCST